MSNPKAEVYAGIFDTAIKATVAAAGNIPEAKRLYQAAEGKGHPLWFLGHATFSLNQIVNGWALGGDSVVPEEYRGPFSPGMAGGASITADASKYPSWDEVLANYEKAGAKVIEGLKALDDADLPGDLKGDVPGPAKSFFGNLESTLQSMAAHDAYHRGQMNALAGLGD